MRRCELYYGDPMVELHEFVKETLVAVLRGVREAQVAAEEFGGFVNPPFAARDYYDKTGTPLESIAFDVAVTANEEHQVGGGVRLGIPVLSAEAGTKSKGSEVTTNRIKFVVPIVYPPHVTPKKPAGA
jgi:hypothetical protein